jgi:hypothetical protein
MKKKINTKSKFTLKSQTKLKLIKFDANVENNKPDNLIHNKFNAELENLNSKPNDSTHLAITNFIQSLAALPMDSILIEQCLQTLNHLKKRLTKNQIYLFCEIQNIILRTKKIKRLILKHSRD